MKKKNNRFNCTELTDQHTCSKRLFNTKFIYSTLYIIKRRANKNIINYLVVSIDTGKRGLWNDIVVFTDHPFFCN